MYNRGGKSLSPIFVHKLNDIFPLHEYVQSRREEPSSPTHKPPTHHFCGILFCIVVCIKRSQPDLNRRQGDYESYKYCCKSFYQNSLYLLYQLSYGSLNIIFKLCIIENKIVSLTFIYNKLACLNQTVIHRGDWIRTYIYHYKIADSAYFEALICAAPYIYYNIYGILWQYTCSIMTKY